MNRLTESLTVSAQSILPIVLLLAVGVFLKKRGTVSAAFEAEANRVVFQWALPLYLFNALYQTRLEAGFSLRLVLLGIGVSAGCALLLLLILPRFLKERRRIAAFTSCSVHGGAVFPGIILGASLLGEAERTPFLLALPFWAVTNNLYSILLFSLNSPRRPGAGETSGRLLRQIGQNPLIWGVAAGAGANLLGLRLPAFLSTVIGYLSGLTTPLALITLGASLRWRVFKDNFQDSFVSGVLIKLVALPAVGCLIAWGLDFRPNEMAALFIHWATPVGISVYSIAVALEGDSRLVGNGIIVSAALSCVTLFVGIFLLSIAGYV